MDNDKQVLELDDSTFDNAVRSGVALVDFWAPWCGPCQMQAPILERVASAIGGRAAVVKLNVDRAPLVSARYGIRSIPTLAVFKEGEPVGAFLGVQNEQTLVETLERVLTDEPPHAAAGGAT